MITAEVKVQWNGPRVARGALATMLEAIHYGAKWQAEKTRDNISTQGPPASTPGEFPHQDQGDLLRSIRVVENRSQKSFRVIADCEHADFVEETRSYLRRTYLENKSELRRIVLDRARIRFGHFRLG